MHLLDLLLVYSKLQEIEYTEINIKRAKEGDKKC